MSEARPDDYQRPTDAELILPSESVRLQLPGPTEPVCAIVTGALQRLLSPARAGHPPDGCGISAATVVPTPQSLSAEADGSEADQSLTGQTGVDSSERHGYRHAPMVSGVTNDWETGDEAAILRAVAAAPDDDTPRLVYADWLDDHDRFHQAAIIRVQCEMAAVHRLDPVRYEFLRDRERELSQFASPSDCPRFASLAPFDVGFERGFPRYVGVNPSNLGALTSALNSYPTITSAILWDFGPNHMKEITHHPAFARLEEVDFKGSRIGDDGCTQLAESCLWIGRVASLGLAYNAVTSAGVMSLLRSPYLGPGRRGGTLVRLSLGGNRVTDEGVAALAESEVASGLRSLALWQNPLSDDCATPIARTASFGSLEDLDLSGTRVTPAGEQTILRSPRLPRLRRLAVT